MIYFPQQKEIRNSCSSRLLSKHIDDLVSDNRIIKSDIGFTETQINLSDATSKITETLNFFNINFSNNKNRFSSSTHRYSNDVTV